MSVAMIVLVLAGLASLVAWIWLIVWAFQNQEKGWGIVLIVSMFLPIVGPLLGLVFCILKWRQVSRPAMILIASTIVGLIGFGVLVQETRKAIQVALQEQAGEAQVRQLFEASRAADSAPEAPEDSTEPPREPAPREPQAVRSPPVSSPVSVPTPPRGAEVLPRAPEGRVGRDRTTVVRPPDLSPLEVDFVSLGPARDNQLRTLRVRVCNEVPKTVREMKLTLHYVDSKGKRLGSWMTVHGPVDSLVGPQATNEVEVQGFFVPRFTESVDIHVDGVAFSDGTRWPEGR